jgi:hypothetical protein
MQTFTVEEIRARYEAWRTRGEQTDSNILARMIGELLDSHQAVDDATSTTLAHAADLEAVNLRLTAQVADLEARLALAQAEAAAAQQHADPSGS